jgi:hypothetical protein
MKKLAFGAALAALTLLITIPAAQATPVGNLDIANCAGGGVRVSPTAIDWLLPVGPPNGCIMTGTTTAVTFSGGTLGPAQTGSILDLTIGGGTVPNFITFASAPTLHFDLSSVGPGACPGGTVLGSFCLSFDGTNTNVSLKASGSAGDATGTSPWNGSFTTQFPNMTPAQIQAALASQGFVQNTYSAGFAITTVPEPTTLGSMALGLLLIGAGAIRRRITR